MKKFNGKAIYNPSGKAGEYSQWACNFYVGCSNGCEYCYCKKGILKAVMGMDKPQLKKCFKDEKYAIEIFEKELKLNHLEIKKHGIFFSFTTDPMLPETYSLTLHAMGISVNNFIPVKILTKCTNWVDDFLDRLHLPEDRKLIAFGFTLTGHDELEPNASTNDERIEAMRKLHNAGFKTWASIEPVIDFAMSSSVIMDSYMYCDLYKIGLMSGKQYEKAALKQFVSLTSEFLSASKVYYKDSLLKQAGIDRASLPSNCVGRDHNIF
jgi:DNA repair photolyase